MSKAVPCLCLLLLSVLGAHLAQAHKGPVSVATVSVMSYVCHPTTARGPHLQFIFTSIVQFSPLFIMTRMIDRTLLLVQGIHSIKLLCELSVPANAWYKIVTQNYLILE